MLVFRLTENQQNILLDPAPLDLWGPRGEVAHKIKSQAAMLQGGIELDPIDVAVVNAAAHELRTGRSLGDPHTGGWNAGALIAIVSAERIRRVLS